MSLTTATSLSYAQLLTLKTNIGTNFPGAGDTPDDDFAIAEWYNETASPQFVVWKTQVLAAEYEEVIVWSELDNITEPRWRIWTAITQNMTREFKPYKANVRQGLAEAFQSATAQQTRDALIAISKRDATRIERLFATGTGTTGSPGDLVIVGPVDHQTIRRARRAI